MRLIAEHDVIDRIVSVKNRIRKYKELPKAVIDFAEQTLFDVQTRVNCCPARNPVPEFIDADKEPPKLPCLVLTKYYPRRPVWCESLIQRTDRQTKEVAYYDGSALMGLSDEVAIKRLQHFDYRGKRITHWMPVRFPSIWPWEGGVTDDD